MMMAHMNSHKDYYERDLQLYLDDSKRHSLHIKNGGLPYECHFGRQMPLANPCAHQNSPTGRWMEVQLAKPLPDLWQRHALDSYQASQMRKRKGDGYGFAHL